MSTHIFGIRHHGPGSARTLRAALQTLDPDAILVEGPPDAERVLPLLVHAQMVPPVALLVYAPAALQRAAFFPFARFSPEWQALRFGLAHKRLVRFMDLPQSHALALEGAQKGPTEEKEKGAAPPADPLALLAEAAGFEDGEQWWEQMVELRQDSRDLFAAVLEMMSALREALPELETAENERREAYMRRVLRAVQREGYERIAVVCGAWHAPAFVDPPLVKEDDALLKRLSRIKVVATWVPWTHRRLARFSGYGAGINAPGWYRHLWQHPQETATAWLTRVARLLRGEGLDASPAQVIDAVRLAESLAALRNRPRPALAELNEAALAVLCQGERARFALIQERLIVGEEMGRVPEDAPVVPLQADLRQEQRRLHMRVRGEESFLRLDLRKPLHLERSYLLHRLNLLGVAWGHKEDGGPQQGTFREVWRLRWDPALDLALIGRSAWGDTVAAAATNYAIHLAEAAAALPELTRLTQHVLLADLGDAVPAVIYQLQARSALTGDVTLLMRSLPPLVDALLYGNVRNTGAGMVRAVVDGIVVRVCVGLPSACASLADEAAAEMFSHLVSSNCLVHLLRDGEHEARWHALMAQLLQQETAHPLLRGRACRILLDGDVIPFAEIVRQMRLAVAAAAEPARAAAWLEGFLRDSGLVLIHHQALLQTLDEWVDGLESAAFTALLPLLRRTFATLAPGERKEIGRLVSRLRRGRPVATAPGGVLNGLDQKRAAAVLPVFARLLGVRPDGGGGNQK